MFRRKMRLVLTSTGVVGGLALTMFSLEDLKAAFSISQYVMASSVLIVTLGGLMGGLIGFFTAPAVTWTEGRLIRTPLLDLVMGAVGLIVGLLIAGLLSLTVARIPVVGTIVSVMAALVFGYLGVSIAAKKREEMAGALGRWAGPIRAKEGTEEQRRSWSTSPKVLDTSVIIDGRIADIVQTGFLEGPLVIPNFVLEELRHIADSPDVLKRNRGRRGLDILNRIQKELGHSVQIYEKEVGEGLEVDTKLLRLGKILRGKIVTNDYNLNKVAELQGVPVLNINELANAVKPAVLPGEEMLVTVIKDGKEMGQGVAYLDDGTMIVVDGGRKYIGQTIGVLVTSVLQTAAGRMIFAKPRTNHTRERAVQ